MDKNFDETANETIDLLEGRLHRIDFVISGDQSENEAGKGSISALTRLRDLEHDLDRLVAKSRVIHDLLKLYTRFPDLFRPENPFDQSSSLDPAAKASVVRAAASSYPMTASGLTSILDTPVAQASSSTQLIETKNQVAEISTLQDSQVRDIVVLKERSTAVLQRWYDIGILQAGECWADLEDRVEHVEQAQRILARTQRSDDEGIKLGAKSTR